MTNLLVKLVWIVTTNWVPVQSSGVYVVPCDGYYKYDSTGGSGGKECSTLTSNLVMKITWKKEVKEFTLESIPFLVTNRTWKMEKVYEAGESEPPPVTLNMTNFYTIATNGGCFFLENIATNTLQKVKPVPEDTK